MKKRGRNRIIRALSLALASASFAALLTGCGQSGEWTPSAYQFSEASSLPDGVVVEKYGYQLLWRDSVKQIALHDVERNYTWDPMPEGSITDGYANPRLCSPFILDYIDHNTGSVTSIEAYSGSIELNGVSCERQGDVLVVTYFFPDLEIAIPVEYGLSADGLVVSVDPTKIQENSNQVVSISLLPFLCSMPNQAEDSYLFFPSGSGALIYPKELSRSGVTVSQRVYGEDPMTDIRYKVSEEESVRLPVYGVKKGNSALCAIIRSGAEAASVNALVGPTGVRNSAVYASFELRGNLSLRSKLFNQIKTTAYYSTSMMKTKIEVVFHPLYGDEASYVGMADTYRQYLQAVYGMEKREGQEDTVLNVQMIGGAMVSKSFLGIPYKSLLPTTNLSQASAIIQDLQTLTDRSLAVELIGFGQTGIDIGKPAGGFTVSSRLGSAREWEQLLQTCRGEDIPLYLDLELVAFSKSGSGWSATFDTAKGTNFQTVYQYAYDRVSRSQDEDNRYVLLSRSALAQAGQHLLDKTASLGNVGIGLGRLSSLAYSDYSQIEYYSRSGMAADVSGLISTVRDGGKSVLASGANDYAAACADRIMDAPMQSGQLDAFDVDIPFYAIVFRGYVPLAGTALNLSVDADELFLRSVESGCGLTYAVTAAYDPLLSNSNYPYFSRTVYEDLKDDMASNVERISAYLDDIRGAEITAHEVLDNGLRKTSFSNGTIVYTNFSDTQQQTEFGPVAPRDFVTGEGQ